MDRGNACPLAGATIIPKVNRINNLMNAYMEFVLRLRKERGLEEIGRRSPMHYTSAAADVYFLL